MRVITGSARGTRLLAPDGLETRPTADKIKEALFSAIQFDIEGRRVLDLFAGSGQLGIEALSRGAASAVFVDNRQEAVMAIRENLAKTKLSTLAEKIAHSDYKAFLNAEKAGGRYGVIFIDPPYGRGYVEKALAAISAFDLCAEGGIIICETGADESLPDAVPPALIKSREYRHGIVKITLYRREAQ